MPGGARGSLGGIFSYLMKKLSAMNITRGNGELHISIPEGLMRMEELQELLNLLRYRTLVSRSQATDSEVEQLTDEINQSLEEANRQHRKQDRA